MRFLWSLLCIVTSATEDLWPIDQTIENDNFDERSSEDILKPISTSMYNHVLNLTDADTLRVALKTYPILAHSAKRNRARASNSPKTKKSIHEKKIIKKRNTNQLVCIFSKLEKVNQNCRKIIR